MSPRPRSVISPPLPARARKVKATPPERQAWHPRPGQLIWRVRDLGQTDPKLANTYLPTREAAEDLADAFGGVVETLYRGYWALPHREVPTVADLARGGEDTEPLARLDPQTNRWVVDPIGYEIIDDALLGRDE